MKEGKRGIIWAKGVEFIYSVRSSTPAQDAEHFSADGVEPN